MLYLIGLGLNSKGISQEGIEYARRCKKIYLENYTVDFPYPVSAISELLGKKVELADRDKVEGLSIIDEAQKLDIALLIYGSPLTATTHITILDECNKSGIRCKIVPNASILDAVAETGLQLYKFGKITSMPAWRLLRKPQGLVHLDAVSRTKESYEPDSFMRIVKENQGINAHSLILIDIGLDIRNALEQLEKSAEKQGVELKKLIICQSLGTGRQKIFYKKFEEFKEFTSVKKPYCIIIPGQLHHVEKDFLESFA
jgi:diphthine synthase